MREQVLKEWNSLKAKVNSLKLSEQKQKVVDYLDSCGLGTFTYNLKDEGLEKWEEQLKQIKVKINEFDSTIEINNDLVSGYNYLAFISVTTFLNWIEKRRTISDLENKVFELENWKRTSHCLLFQAKSALMWGVSNTFLLIESKENKSSIANLDVQFFTKNYEFMKKTRSQISKIDFPDWVYENSD